MNYSKLLGNLFIVKAVKKITNYLYSSDKIISSFYRGILGRNPDEGGLKIYKQVFQRLGINQTIDEMLREFLQSEEYTHKKLHASVRLIDGINRGNGIQINGEKISHIVSLGTHCLTSSILKKWNLKNYSLPFDWLFSCPNTVLDCLSDDFEIFLDKSFYQPIPRITGDPGAQHLWYLEKYGVQDVFAHRDPTAENDYQYTTRTVDRFRNLMRSDDAKLFFMICSPDRNLGNRFSDLSNCIRAMTKNSAFIAVTLTDPASNAGCMSLKLLSSESNHSFYEFTPSSKERGLGFPDPIDELALLRLIQQYDIELE